MRQIEVHNADLREKAAAIPARESGGLSVDDFCALPAREDTDEAIQLAEHNLAAAREKDAVRDAAGFDPLGLPGFDIVEISEVLTRDLPALDAAAVEQVQAHLAEIGPGSEVWIAEGMRRIDRVQGTVRACPFCAQDLGSSPVIRHYRAYFSEEYSQLKLRVSATLAEVNRLHGRDAPAGFERSVRILSERHHLWSRFCDVPPVELDTAAIARDWQAARNAILAALEAKRAAPLERIQLTPEALSGIERFETRREAVSALNERLHQANRAISIVKEQAATADPRVIEANLIRLRAVKARHATRTAALCDEYLRARTAKEQTEGLRDNARAALEQYRRTAFPGYQTAINMYLQRFNAGYRVDGVSSADTRGGPTCNYNVLINNVPVAVAGGAPTPGDPSFRNTLSSGDRNTLALAFFFASLDQDPGLANKVVVIDDPITSLDEHRSLTTVQQLRQLGLRTSQLIVLSHSKAFLCSIWKGIDPTQRAALSIVRQADGSTIATWDVDQDSATEHDRRHAMLREYISLGPRNNSREIARSVRPLLEAFLRIAYPEHFPPGALLGQFRNLCEQRCGTAQEILSAPDAHELRDLVEYSNRFHHDTNPAWETEAINDGALRGFVERALTFARR